MEQNELLKLQYCFLEIVKRAGSYFLISQRIFVMMLLTRKIEMSPALMKNAKTITELKDKTRAILNQVHRTKKPVVVTVNGKPDVVLLDAEVFERKLKALNLKRLINEADEAIRQGKTRPAREFLKDFKKRAKIHR